MKATVKNISDTRVLVTVTLGADELAAAEQVALKKLSKDVKVNGFRKGHVPIEVVKKNVDPAALSQETVENALSKGVAEAYLNNNLQALERPEVEIKKFVPGDVLEFTAEGDVLRGHEFHYSDFSPETPAVLACRKVRDGMTLQQWSGGWQVGNTFDSYLHLHFAQRPIMLNHWLAAARSVL